MLPTWPGVAGFSTCLSYICEDVEIWIGVGWIYGMELLQRGSPWDFLVFLSVLEA